jgi:hypothetical protein
VAVSPVRWFPWGMQAPARPGMGGVGPYNSFHGRQQVGHTPVGVASRAQTESVAAEVAYGDLNNFKATSPTCVPSSAADLRPDSS